MPYNNSYIGNMNARLIINIFNQFNATNIPSPSGDYFLLTDGGSPDTFLLDDSDDFLLSD
jgi:hypothetical protein